MNKFSKDQVYIGETDKRGEPFKFGIKGVDRSRHMYVIGRTGTGKSTLLEIMALQDMRNGNGLIFLDPHGQSVDNLLSFTPRGRLDDIIYFAPHLQERPIGLNIMEDVGYDKRHLVVSSLLSSFHKIWGENTWSDRMEYILSNTLLALLEYPETTLMDIGRMYSNKTFRKNVIDNIKDPQVRTYWTEEYAKYNDSYLRDATPAIQNKLGQFTSNPLIRNIVGQTKSSFDFREIIDNEKILLCNLSKGLIGENNAKMLGILFTTKIYLSALSRSDLPRKELLEAPPCNFYVDEFQSFANSSFADILSEARKYKLNLILAHQYVGQLYSDDQGNGNAVRDAVFGNVGTFISFRVGPVDAEIIAKQFHPYVAEEDLTLLANRHMFLTLGIDGVQTKPFSARTFQIEDPPVDSLADEVIKRTYEKYGADREEIEKQIKEKLEFAADINNEKPKKDRRDSPRKKFSEVRPKEKHNETVNIFKKIGESMSPPSVEKKEPVVVGNKEPVVDSENSGKTSLDDLIKSTKAIGLKKDLKVIPERKVKKPDINYQEGWVSLKDIQGEIVDKDKLTDKN